MTTVERPIWTVISSLESITNNPTTDGSVLSYFLKIMQGIYECESIIAGGLDDQYAMILELFLGGLLMGTLIFFALQTYQPYFIILVGGIGAVITGLFVAGGALILSGLTRVRALVRRKQKPSNSTLADYRED